MRIRVSPLCIQYLAKVLPVAVSLWAISFSWCGKIRSMPPPWMSNVSPRYAMLMAEHSMCQPGRPLPHGLFQAGSPGLAAFHRAKSAGCCALPARSRVPASDSSTRAAGELAVVLGLGVVEVHVAVGDVGRALSISRLINSMIAPMCCVACGKLVDAVARPGRPGCAK